MFSLTLLIIHLIQFKSYFEKDEENKENQKAEIKKNEIIQMKSNFKNKTTLELEQIINGNGYRKEAINAAKQLVEDRKKNIKIIIQNNT